MLTVPATARVCCFTRSRSPILRRRSEHDKPSAREKERERERERGRNRRRSSHEQPVRGEGDGRDRYVHIEPLIHMIIHLPGPYLHYNVCHILYYTIIVLSIMLSLLVLKLITCRKFSNLTNSCACLQFLRSDFPHEALFLPSQKFSPISEV